MTPAGVTQYKAAVTRLGAGEQAATEFGWALRDAPPDPALTPEACDDLWAEWWGDRYEANANAFERVWKRLTATEQAEIRPRLHSRRVTEGLVKLGYASR